MGQVSETNRRLVFDHLVEHPRGVIQSDLSRATGVSRGTINTLINADSLLELDGERVSGVGRPGKVVRIAPEAGVLIGAAITHRHFTAGIAELDGGWIVPPEGGDLEQSDDAMTCLDKTAQLIARLLDQVPGGPKKVAEVAVALPVPIGDDGRTRPSVSGAVSLDRWQEEIDVSGNLRIRLPELGHCNFPPLNDADAALLAQLAVGLPPDVEGEPVETALLVKWASGIGSAIWANGQVNSGEEGLAGEVGHILVPRFASEAAREAAKSANLVIAGKGEWKEVEPLWEITHPCPRCELFGCLEQYAGGDAISKGVERRLGLDAPVSIDWVVERAAVDADEHFEETETTACREALVVAAEFVGRVLGGVATQLNPGLIIFGGAVPRADTAYWLSPMQRAFKQSVLPAADSSVTFTRGQPEDDSAVTGAVEFARRQSLAAWLVDQGNGAVGTPSGSSGPKRD